VEDARPTLLRPHVVAIDVLYPNHHGVVCLARPRRSELGRVGLICPPLALAPLGQDDRPVAERKLRPMVAGPPALGKAERFAEPVDCLGDVVLDELWDQHGGRHRAVLDHRSTPA
jgi:hypothetical protein